MARDLSGLDVAAMMIDGIVFADCCCVVAFWPSPPTAPRCQWACGRATPENTTVVKDLLADLVARGMACEEGVLFILDGSKALAAGVNKVFGDRALIQRCTLPQAAKFG